MGIETVIVFGATGTQGRPQVKELLRQGYSVKAVSRKPDLLDHPDFAVPGMYRPTTMMSLHSTPRWLGWMRSSTRPNPWATWPG